jgi:DNA repair protein RadC
MHVLLLDARGCYMSRMRVASGGVSACSVYVKDILAPAIEARAARFFIVHNHPSGISRPSPEDVSLTSKVASASELLGLTLVDHVVVADDGFSSAFPGRRNRGTP